MVPRVVWRTTLTFRPRSFGRTSSNSSPTEGAGLTHRHASARQCLLGRSPGFHAIAGSSTGENPKQPINQTEAWATSSAMPQHDDLMTHRQRFQQQRRKAPRFTSGRRLSSAGRFAMRCKLSRGFQSANDERSFLKAVCNLSNQYSPPISARTTSAFNVPPGFQSTIARISGSPTRALIVERHFEIHTGSTRGEW
jgi:hypothetical protein